MRHPWFRASAAPRVLAHRGFTPPDAEGIVENSVASLAAAHGAGAVYVESDCHVTADGDVVLFHDEDLRRVAGDPRFVSEVRTRELADIMGDRGGLATLADALEAFPDLHFNLDVKEDAVAAPMGRLIAPHAERVLVSSFSDDRRLRCLVATREAGGEPATSAGQATLIRVVAALSARLGRTARRALDGVDALQIPERHRGIRILTPRLIDTAHAAGVEVHVWTVNAPADMSRLLTAGVDGLVSDRTDLALLAAAAHSRP